VTLVAVQIFLFMEVGAGAIVLSVTLGVVALIHSRLSMSMAQVSREQLHILKDRMKFNIEAFSAIREVKTLGWEDVVVERNRRFRHQENAKNQQYFTLANAYDLLINLTPTLSVLFIFLLEVATARKSRLSPALVYTILSFVGMTYAPSKSLVSMMVGWRRAKSAFERIARFLQEAEDLEERTNF